MQINIVITNCDFYGTRVNNIKPSIAVYVPLSTGNLNVINCMFVNCAKYESTRYNEYVVYFTNNE